MIREFTRRVGRVERHRNPPKAVPHVVEVATGESAEQAIVRFEATHGAMPRDHRFIVVPARLNEAERPVVERQWAAQQSRLLAEVRSPRPKEATS